MDKLKKFYPYIVALLLFIVIPMIYFAPQYAGKDIRKFDNVHAKGMTQPVIDHQEEYGEHPYWVANMFGGMPSYAIHNEKTFDIIKSTGKGLFFIGEPASYYFVLMAGFFFMLLLFGVNPWIAIGGAIAYAFSTYFVVIYEAGHIMKLVALCYVAPMVGALFYTYRRSFWIGAPLFGVFALLLISAVHPQIAYYFVIAMLIMVIAYAIQAYKQQTLKHFFKCSAALLVTSFFAIGANSLYLYYTQSYSEDSTRGKQILTTQDGIPQSSGLDKDYITSWSYGKMESFNMFIPNLTGGKSNGGFANDGDVAHSLSKYVSKGEAERIASQLPGYWGPQPMTSGPVYIGAVMIFLFVLGLFIIKGVNLWWIVGATSLSLLLAWGKNFMPLTDLFINYFPLYDKFRTVSMILVVVELTVPLMAMLALNKVFNSEIDKEQLKKALTRTLYIVGGVALLFLVLGGSLLSFSSPTDAQMGLPQDVISAMEAERGSMLRADAVRSFVFVFLTYILLWAWIGGRIKEWVVISGMVILVSLDMIPIAVRHVNYDMFEASKGDADDTPMTNIDREILKDKDINYRVANLSVSTFNDATTSLYHRSIGGYFAAKPRRYQDIIDRYLSKMDNSVYNMLNAKYFIVPNRDKVPELHTNHAAFGNAWIASSVEVVDSPNREIEAIGEVDLSTTAIVASEFEDMLSSAVLDKSINDEITHTSYKANRLVYKSKLNDNRLIVFSEMYYPKGWKAYIDGKEVPYLRANYILNALVVPAGEHTIVFEFKPPHIAAIRTVSVVSSLMLLLMLVGGFILNNRCKN